MNGKNILLRAVELADLDLIYQWEYDKEVWQVSNTLTPFSRYIIEQYILNSVQDIFTAKQLRLMIENIDCGKNKTVGSIDLFDYDPLHRRAGIGILVANSERRKGFASEALELIKSYAFETLQLHQLYCHISSDNFSSLELFKKHGFVICGIRKDWLLNNGKWVDEYILQFIYHAEEND